MLGWRKKAKTPKASPKVERDGARHDVFHRVMSRDLPEYSALTTDLSRTGVQLETSGPLEVGLKLELSLEFDKEDLADFSCPATVVWTKQVGVSRRFRAGLTFNPETDDERRNLYLMATVLQARTETDLAILLEEAKRVDPDRAETYARVSEKNPDQENATLRAIANHPGAYIPMSVMIEGYAWNRRKRTLTLAFLDGVEVHKLYFPSCQMMTDYKCAAEIMVMGMFTTFTSAAVRKLQMNLEEEEIRKHYRFVGEGGMPILDLVSAPAQTYPPENISAQRP